MNSPLLDKPPGQSRLKYLPAYSNWIFAFLLQAFVLTCFCANSAFCNQTVQQFQGYLSDKQCAEAVREDSDPGEFLRHHTKDCALMPNCKAKGYVLYCKKEWLDLDKKGNQLAIELLKNSKRKGGYFVAVNASRKGNLLTVESLKEIDNSPAGTADKMEQGTK